GLSRRGVAGALCARAHLDAARVPRYAVAKPTPQFVKGLARRFADDVPQRDFHTPAAVSIAEDARVLLEREWVASQQARLDPTFEDWRGRVARRPPPNQPVVGRELDERCVAPAPG